MPKTRLMTMAVQCMQRMNGANGITFGRQTNEWEFTITLSLPPSDPTIKGENVFQDVLNGTYPIN